MIDNERFIQIAAKVQRNEFLTPEDGKDLIETMAELDAHLMILQNTLSFTLAAAISKMETLGSRSVDIMGDRDRAKVKKMAALYGNAAGQLEAAVSLYLAGQVEAAAQAVQEDSAVDGLDGESVGDGEGPADTVGADDQ